MFSLRFAKNVKIFGYVLETPRKFFSMNISTRTSFNDFTFRTLYSDRENHCYMLHAKEVPGNVQNF